MLVKTENNVITKYIYGLGLIAEETGSDFKVYHFDYRGSTVALTDLSGTVTDRFAYDTYGRLIEHTGNSDIIFLYNGRDGVVTDTNGLYYMRARYYNPAMRRFVNTDILAGSLDKFVTLNRYAYADCNPVMCVDSRGLSAERGNTSTGRFNRVVFGDGSITSPNNKRISLPSGKMVYLGYTPFTNPNNDRYPSYTLDTGVGYLNNAQISVASHILRSANNEEYVYGGFSSVNLAVEDYLEKFYEAGMYDRF